MTILKANSLIKVYGGYKKSSSTKALKGVDISINEGEFVGIMGPSGSGKTTLLNILGGIDKPTSGIVKIHGEDLFTMDKNKLALYRRKNIGFIFQEFNLLDSLTLKENIMLPMILDKKKKGYMEKKTLEIMKAFHIDDIKDKYPWNVSGGQQQRAAACRALVNDPKIVMADEPTGNLDSKSSRDIMNSLERINEREGSTILMVTHDPFTASFCKKIVFIKDGMVNLEINREGSRKEFFDKILDCLSIMGGDRP